MLITADVLDVTANEIMDQLRPLLIASLPAHIQVRLIPYEPEKVFSAFGLTTFKTPMRAGSINARVAQMMCVLRKPGREGCGRDGKDEVAFWYANVPSDHVPSPLKLKVSATEWLTMPVDREALEVSLMATGEHLAKMLRAAY